MLSMSNLIFNKLKPWVSWHRNPGSWDWVWYSEDFKEHWSCQNSWTPTNNIPSHKSNRDAVVKNFCWFLKSCSGRKEENLDDCKLFLKRLLFSLHSFALPFIILHLLLVIFVFLIDIMSWLHFTFICFLYFMERGVIYCFSRYMGDWMALEWARVGCFDVCEQMLSGSFPPLKWMGIKKSAQIYPGVNGRNNLGSL